MKTFSTYAIALTTLLLYSCSNHTTSPSYSIAVAVPQGTEEGTQIYLTDYDTDARIDSAVVAGDTLLLRGEINQPTLVRIKFPSARRTFILEPGNISLDADGVATGTQLNDEFEEFGRQLEAIETIENDSTVALLRNMCHQALSKENPVGYFALLQLNYYIDLNELDSLLTTYPYYSEFNRIKRNRSAKQQETKTAPGMPYADFEVIASDSDTIRLSDYVKPDCYTLVDYWASWCRYCIMEIPNIKSLVDSYGNKGLNVVGVAVWDEKDASEQSIAKHSVTWPQILNAQNVPTDLYGITGIPQIMLIGPDGKIVARNLQGERLKAVVDSVMADFTITK
ncbi:MAG: AhpC/TSA family protein [Muribaculum sp.]|nr:AhpC/TSA family protein [Muribaculum sp.]